MSYTYKSSWCSVTFISLFYNINIYGPLVLSNSWDIISVPSNRLSKIMLANSRPPLSHTFVNIIPSNYSRSQCVEISVTLFVLHIQAFVFLLHIWIFRNNSFIGLLIWYILYRTFIHTTYCITISYCNCCYCNLWHRLLTFWCRCDIMNDRLKFFFTMLSFEPGIFISDQRHERYNFVYGTCFNIFGLNVCTNFVCVFSDWSSFCGICL